MEKLPNGETFNITRDYLTSEELQELQFDHKTAMQRFLHKFLYHRKEFKKFKSYEKHYAYI